MKLLKAENKHLCMYSWSFNKCTMGVNITTTANSWSVNLIQYHCCQCNVLCMQYYWLVKMSAMAIILMHFPTLTPWCKHIHTHTHSYTQIHCAHYTNIYIYTLCTCMFALHTYMPATVTCMHLAWHIIIIIVSWCVGGSKGFAMIYVATIPHSGW